MSVKRITVIFGPTASGKSAVALEKAAIQQGVIVNADALQLYQELRILTARPSAEEEAQIPHRLYGVLQGNQPASAAWWAAQAAGVIRGLWAEEKTVILCGGTGLYLQTLQQGIAPIPEIPAEIRAEIGTYQNEALMALLQQHDPLMAMRLKMGDTQRLRRAAEVWQATGKPLSEWQAQPPQPFLPEAEWEWIFLNPPRAVLYERINQRFITMMDQGAEAEVAALLAKQYPSTAPIMKAVGVPEIARYLRGECTREAAIITAQQHSRNYAKRQITWLKNQFGDKASPDA
jgi:tRNA dimethylallyltransferase